MPCSMTREVAVDPVTFYKCLSDDTRLHSVLLLEQVGELCVCELVAALGLSQPKVSRHLRQLRECGLLSTRREGQWIYYRLNPVLPVWATGVLAQTAAGNRVYLRDAMARLGEVTGREAMCC